MAAVAQKMFSLARKSRSCSVEHMPRKSSARFTRFTHGTGHEKAEDVCLNNGEAAFAESAGRLRFSGISRGLMRPQFPNTLRNKSTSKDLDSKWLVPRPVDERPDVPADLTNIRCTGLNLIPNFIWRVNDAFVLAQRIKKNDFLVALFFSCVPKPFRHTKRPCFHYSLTTP